MKIIAYLKISVELESSSNEIVEPQQLLDSFVIDTIYTFQSTESAIVRNENIIDAELIRQIE